MIVVFAMEIVQPYLAGVSSLPVVSKVPRKRPPAFIRVDTGPPRRRTLVTDETLVIIQVYGPGLDMVLGEIEALREAMFEFDGKDNRVLDWEEDSGPHEWPDPDLDSTIRWQFTGRLTQALQ
ncbi:hypothetical protein [Corynebacterium pygosceleis]|uniref:hypothetical protein n=1 Tax=Corynebacterium pygosceleis TaxID=2800406 RepID=UPI00200424BB|nr:hypothetical protein [Corynebacterium pygosceleis]MCK7676358.1 hypothetical protein [Corynebacterium pygosceleis]